MKKLLFVLLGLPLLLKADTSLVFNEIMYHPATNETELEWVEFHNQMAVDIDVSDWKITGGIDYTFPAGTVVEGGSYIVVALNPAALEAATGAQNALGPFTGRLANSGETLRLQDINARVVDEISYGTEAGWPVGPDGGGVSLAKRNRDTASAPSENWVSSNQIGGSPGTTNFAFEEGPPPATPLIELQSSWSYEDSGTDLGTAWRNPGFDDSGWATENGPLRTTVPPTETRAIPTLYNSGVDENRNPVANGGSDPHYRIIAAAQGAINRQATVILNHPAWLANDSNSKFIGVVNPGETSINGGTYTFQTTFSLDGADPATAQIQIRAAIDNTLNSVTLNGVNTGISAAGFDAFRGPFNVSSGFIAGINTLVFQTANEGAGPGGFRVELAGTAAFTSTNPPLANADTHYFRRGFNFFGDPSNVDLNLNLLLDDGAVVYLNGVEVHRQNMPAGPVGFSTLASSDVVTPTLSGPVSIPITSLLSGLNVLAVEVHQSAPGATDMVFDAELTSTPLPSAVIDLAFNEVSGSTNTPFQVELHNHGTLPIDLQGFVIHNDGATDQEFVFPAGPLLDPGQLTFVFLGFQPQTGDKLLLLPPARNQILDGRVVKDGPRARLPAGTGPWLHPDSLTPGGINSFSLHNEIVINEIMYHHQRLPGTNGLPPAESPEAWIELHNRSASPVNLAGWQFADGISYSFPSDTVIAPGAYLVVASDAAALSARFPGIDIVGDFGGRLSHKEDRIVLEDANGNPADEVHYYDGGRWSDQADGGGPSLELRNPSADNSRGEAWAPSSESDGASWRTYTYRGIAGEPTPAPNQPTNWRDFILGLLGPGECLIDDISVIENPDTTPVQFVSNGNFENGLNGWRVPGNHGYSRVIVDPDNGGNHALHIVASGPQEHMNNHIETTILGGLSTVNGREYEISFRAKWLTGSRFLNTRLYFNRVARSTELESPMLNGTPGTQNSRFEPNIGPTFNDLQHSPVVPEPGQTVAVSVVAEDPDAIASVTLRYSVNGGAFASSIMSHQGNGLYQASVPSQNAGTIVQFYVQALDTLGASSTFPAAGPDSGALYEVDNNETDFSQGHNLRLILTPANRQLLHALTNVMSNARLPATLIYNEKRPYYDMGARLKGSEHGRFNNTRTSFNLQFNPDQLFRGVHPAMLIDRSGAGDTGSNKQEEILIRHMLLRAGGLPGPRPDLCRIIAPLDIHNDTAILSPRHEDEFFETQFTDGGDGNLHELELIYVLSTANADGYKEPQSNPGVVHGQDYTNLGNDKENYRYNFIKKTNRDSDDWDRFIAFAKGFALSGDELGTYTRQTMDIDQWMRAWAFLNLCGVGDMYSYGNNHNFMVYLRPSDQKFLAIPWDMDFSFNRGATAGLVGDQNVAKIINLPANFRSYAAHFLDLLDTVYNAAYMTPWISHYNEFNTQDYSGRIGYINTRNASVRSQLDAMGNTVGFTVNPPALNGNVVLLTGTAPFSAKTIRANGIAYPMVWNSLTAWEMRVPVAEATNILEIAGYHLRGHPLPSLSQTILVEYAGTPPSPADHIVFNEIMYHPALPGAAFLELLNTSPDFAFDLSGYSINGIDYSFPTGAVILPGGLYLVAENMPSFLAAYGTDVPMPDGIYDGNLDRGGETLSLLKTGPAGDELIDRVRYDDLTPWPAAADGTGPSLQLINASADNSRVNNWADGAGWRFFSYTGTIGGDDLRLFLNAAGTVYIDNFSLVAGSVPEAGVNLVPDGDFEGTFAAPWSRVSSHSTSDFSTEQAFAGNQSLKIVATAAGSPSALVGNFNIPGIISANTYTMSFWLLPTTSGPDFLTARFGSAFRPEVVVTPVFFTPGQPNSVAAAGTAYPELWLNEIQPSNTVGIMDNTGERDPWVELYNAGPTPINLTGYFLSDNYGNLAQWPFPADSMIEPGEYKLVFLDAEPDETTATELHASFGISSPTGAVALARSLGGIPQLVDYLNYPAVSPALSYGDLPDGQPFNQQIIFTATPGAPNQPRDVNLFINEWLAQNTGNLTDPADEDLDDWFEIYNAGTTPVDLSGFFLTDDLLDKTKFTIPNGYIVPAGGFLLVWADDETSQNDINRIDLHASFKLSTDGEQIGLYTPELLTVDEITYTNQVANVSEGRFPDATPNFFPMPGPTPRGFNSLGEGNTAPLLDPIPNTSLPQGTTLSFSATATDNDVPAQTLTYTLDPGAPAGAMVDPASGLFTWTPSPAQAEITHVITLRVTDDGAPPRDAFRTFEVTVLAAPQVTILNDAGTISLTFPTTPGKTYQAEFTETLTPIDWMPLGPSQVASGNELTIMDLIGANPQRFYRFVQLD